MGQCFCIESEITRLALKFPHGTSGIEYDPSSEQMKECDVQTWLQQRYADNVFTNWIVYNDQSYNQQHSKAHAKGVVAWNDKRISWLIHSVPHFPNEFNGQSFPPINPSELVYGQSFLYHEVPLQNELLYSIIQQLVIMDVHVMFYHYDKGQPFHMTFCEFAKKQKQEPKLISEIVLGKNVSHIAKSPQHNIDIYSEYLAKTYPFQWKIQTWKRGLPILTECKSIHDVENMKWKDIEYKTSQDHSKYGVSDGKLVFVGDLNRMSSQLSKGGAIVMVSDQGMSTALGKIVS
jgi:deoxyribonuclease-2